MNEVAELTTLEIISITKGILAKGKRRRHLLKGKYNFKDVPNLPPDYEDNLELLRHLIKIVTISNWSDIKEK